MRWFSLCRAAILALATTLTVAGLGCQRSTSVGEAVADDGKKPLIWAADAEGGAPYVFKDPDNRDKYIGFEVDLRDALAKELGQPIEFKQYEFSSLLSGLERGDFDFAMNGLEITPDRKDKVRFSRPYYVYKLQLVARDGDERFANTKRLVGGENITVGTLEDTAASRLLDKLKIKKKIYPGQVEPYTDLAQGTLDAVLLDLPIALYYGQPDPKLKYAQKNPKLTFVGEPFEAGFYAIALSKKNEALAKRIDAALEKLIKSGALQKIYEKWGLWNDDQKSLAKAGE
jgi:polar amino acid transport system substrate-binding protein